MFNPKRISGILLLIIVILWIVGAYSFAIFVLFYGLGGLLAYVIAIKPMFEFMKSKIESRQILTQIQNSSKDQRKEDCYEKEI